VNKNKELQQQQQVAAVLTAEVRIAAAAYRLRFAISTKYSLYARDAACGAFIEPLWQCDADLQV